MLGSHHETLCHPDSGGPPNPLSEESSAILLSMKPVSTSQSQRPSELESAPLQKPSKPIQKPEPGPEKFAHYILLSEPFYVELGVPRRAARGSLRHLEDPPLFQYTTTRTSPHPDRHGRPLPWCIRLHRVPRQGPSRRKQYDPGPFQSAG